MANFDDFFEKISHQIRNNTDFDSNAKHCDLWLGARTSDGRKLVKFPSGNRVLMHVSRVVYMIKLKMMEIPRVDQHDNILEVSHLCHQTLCVKPDHLVLESKHSNNERKHCLDQGLCTENHKPVCIL